MPITGVATDELLRHILLGSSVQPVAGATGSVKPESADKTPAAMPEEDTKVKAVQKILADLGYAPGPVDGALGDKTTRAITSFQHDRKIAETGQITPELLRELKRVTGRDLTKLAAKRCLPEPMRIKSEIWVRAYLRRCQSEGVSVVIVRRGDEAAGAIFICIDRLDGTVLLYGPAPAGRSKAKTNGAGSVASDLSRRRGRSQPIISTRQRKFDPDLWIIEIEDRGGRHFLGDAGRRIDGRASAPVRSSLTLPAA